MGMFLVKNGTAVKAIKNGQDWASGNWQRRVIKQDMVFDKSEMIVDPTGIAHRYANVPGGVTIGSAYAEAGYYGFRRLGWCLLFKANDVIYG